MSAEDHIAEAGRRLRHLRRQVVHQRGKELSSIQIKEAGPRLLRHANDFTAVPETGVMGVGSGKVEYARKRGGRKGGKGNVIVIRIAIGIGSCSCIR
ncbi:hypothetical protein TYRP_017285 [Tyrophagus putrescentiae]|nr:hypothetical protein TYRP_017285 [Tyrophagus putrescentiae]